VLLGVEGVIFVVPPDTPSGLLVTPPVVEGNAVEARAVVVSVGVAWTTEVDGVRVEASVPFVAQPKARAEVVNTTATAAPAANFLNVDFISIPLNIALKLLLISLSVLLISCSLGSFSLAVLPSGLL
jgi:hypothetical protein